MPSKVYLILRSVQKGASRRTQARKAAFVSILVSGDRHPALAGCAALHPPYGYYNDAATVLMRSVVAPLLTRIPFFPNSAAAEHVMAKSNRAGLKAWPVALYPHIRNMCY